MGNRNRNRDKVERFEREGLDSCWRGEVQECVVTALKHTPREVPHDGLRLYGEVAEHLVRAPPAQ